MQPDAFADAVVVLVKNAIGPVLERLAAAEARLAVLGDVRDRMVVMETKSLLPVPVVESFKPEPVDWSPVLERVAAAEARLDVLGDLRDRVVTVETKAAQPPVIPNVEPPPVVDLSPVVERLAAAEARLEVLGDLRDRVVTVETKSAMPVPLDASISDLSDRLKAIELMQPMTSEKALLMLKSALDPAVVSMASEISAIRERLAVAEVRPLQAGPAGADGQPGRDGKDGLNGKDGADGLGYDELGIEQQPDVRTVKFLAKRGLQVKEFGTLTFPVEMYRGVYVEGKTYDRGDGVTWGGSDWHCNETTTTKPGDGSKAWTLRVKRGRDGKDGRDASIPPIVSIGKR